MSKLPSLRQSERINRGETPHRSTNCDAFHTSADGSFGLWDYCLSRKHWLVKRKSLLLREKFCSLLACSGDEKLDPINFGNLSLSVSILRPSDVIPEFMPSAAEGVSFDQNNMVCVRVHCSLKAFFSQDISIFQCSSPPDAVLSGLTVQRKRRSSPPRRHV